MLKHPTLDKLDELKLFGMRKALEEQLNLPDCQSLSFEERLALLVDREMAERHNRRLALRLAKARLRQQAALEDLDFRHPRGLDKSWVLSLADCQWIAHHDNCLITGPTGAGPVKPISLARSPTKPAAKDTPCSTTACPACSPNSPSPKATDGIPNCCGPWRVWTSRSSMIGERCA